MTKCNVATIGLVLLFVSFFLSCSREKELKVYDLDGVLRYEWSFEKDTLTGKKLSYWPNGQIKLIHHFENGKLNGEFLGYYENGNIARRSHFYNNIIRGLALKFFEHADGLVETETYYLDVKGKQYMYYQKEFDDTGRVINQERTLSIDFDCKRRVARVNFVGDFPYDSVHLVMGRYSADFSLNETESVDTIRASLLPLEILLDGNIVSCTDTVRGKCIFFDGTIQGDSTRVDVKTRYFEQVVMVNCGN
jgi:hypothetical protein